MLQSFAQSQDWFCSEPLFMDDEVCLSLMKDIQGLPTPPQSPPMKSTGQGSDKPLSKEDQLSYVSDILLEDQDMQLNWNCDFFHHLDSAAPCGKECKSRELHCIQLEESGDESLWSCLVTEKTLDEKLGSSMLGCSPVLSQIDTSIFEEIAGTTLDCQNLMDTPESSEATSDYSSTGGELSTSCSDSEEEIDVVTVVRCPSRLVPLPSLAEVTLQQQQEEQQRVLQRQHIEIQLQHNYAAPCPASPPPSSNKRSRGNDGSLRFHHSSRSSSSSSSSSSLLSLKYHQHSSRNSAETEDDEERRRTHNVMERHRRNELKNCFTRLRDNVPEVSHNDKASKVVILKKARDCIYNLEDQAERLQTKKDKLRARQVALKARLELLRS